MIHYARDCVPSNPGNPKHQLYAPKVGANGSVALVEAGFENTDDYIQSFAESTDLKVIMAQVAAGDLAALNRRPGSYGDFTQMPQTFAEALQLQIDSKRLFDSLPSDVRKQFDNDANKFFASAGSQDWFEKIEPVLPDEVKAAIRPPVESPVQPVKPVEKDVKE